ncbi:MAG: aldehyde dehydrogenase family protein [Acidobacteria bacterium]|nr:aldehyde dehydrogenase family protein [Acidobacteriota bacterium]
MTNTVGPETGRRIDDVFAAQRARALALRCSTAQQRIDTLRRLIAAVESHREDICAAAAADFSKPRPEVDLTELLPILAEAKHAIRHLEGWMRPHRVPPTLAMLGTSAEVRYEPRGVTLIIVPWNYPFNLAFCPLVSAIAAGNTAIIKPSEMTPHCSALIRRLVEEIFDTSEVAVFEGDATVATALLERPFDHVFFTGSPLVGRLVMAAAAKHLTSITLELGGKSPAIVDATADLKRAARAITAGKFANSGQTCIAPDYLLVHASVRDGLIAEIISSIEHAYGAGPDPQRATPDYCRIVNEKHYERLRGLFDDAVHKGAKVAYGGALSRDDLFIGPTLLADVAPDSRILEEEIFGPLLPIVTFTDIGEAIAFVNGKPKPLSLYVFSRSEPNIDRVLTETSAGDTCVNHTVIHFLHLNLPFGGVNNSGIGKSHGFFGFTAFSHERSVLRDRFSIVHWMFPPYTERVRALIKITLKWLT